MTDDKISTDIEAKSIFSSVQIKYIRHIVQAQVIILFLYGISRPSSTLNLLWKLDPIQSLSAILSRSNIPLLSLVAAIIMLIATAIFGRAFCGWICPMGFIQDIISFRKFRKWLPVRFRLIKYILLVGGLLMPILSGWTFLGWFSPIPLFTQSLSPFFGRAYFIHSGIVIFIFSVFFTILSERRAWCRYVCPLGALLSLPAASKLIKILLDKNKCIKCKKCDDFCTMGICDITNQPELRWENECILCMACRDICPVNAISLNTIARSQV